MLDFCTRAIFANHQHDGVIAGNGTDDFMEIVHVNVVCQAAGISRTSLDDSDVLAALATFSCFKSRDRVACVNWNPSFVNSCKSSS